MSGLARVAAGLVATTAPPARFADPTLKPTSPFLTAPPTALAEDLKRAIVNSYPVAADFIPGHYHNIPFSWF